MQKKETKLTAKNDIDLVSEVTWRPLRAPFGYYGAKRRLASQIIAELPPHNAWVEAFCGSAALTLAKKPAQIEVINDINGEVVNFFRQLRDNSSKLCRLLRLTPYAREELRLVRLPEKKLTDVERARRFFVAAMMAINGTFGDSPGGFSFSNSYSRRNMEARVSRWKAMPEHLELVAKRLSQVRIENKDSIELFSDFSNRPATLVYFDPPYLADRTQGYDHDQCSEEYHERLLITASKAKCMVFISGYENDLYNDYLTSANGWHKRMFKATTRGHNGKDSKRQEIVWHNEKYATAVKSGRVPVRLSAQEHQQNKVNPMR
ncbi:MAG: DNA adenine methylase [Sterolibacterium sp.]